MTECKFLKYCPLNEECSENCECNIERPMSVIQHFRRKYCHLNPEGCARHKVRKELGESYLPPDLLPFDMERAEEIIENN